MRLRASIWALIAALIVLATRAIVYALAPQSVLLADLAHQEGGPKLAGVLTVAVLVAAAIALAALWVAVVAVRERLALERREVVSAPRLRPSLLAARALVLFAATSFAFAMVESTIHWRAGLGWHGLHCLVGPVHRDAIPILGALTLLAVAAHGAVEHLLLWANRLIVRLAARRPVLRVCAPSSPRLIHPPVRFTGSTSVPRGPPGILALVPSL